MSEPRYDTATAKWFKNHPGAQTTVTQCSDCGLYYKPLLGHKCKMKKQETETKCVCCESNNLMIETFGSTINAKLYFCPICGRKLS